MFPKYNHFSSAPQSSNPPSERSTIAGPLANPAPPPPPPAWSLTANRKRPSPPPPNLMGYIESETKKQKLNPVSSEQVNSEQPIIADETSFLGSVPPIEIRKHNLSILKKAVEDLRDVASNNHEVVSESDLIELQKKFDAFKQNTALLDEESKVHPTQSESKTATVRAYHLLMLGRELTTLEKSIENKQKRFPNDDADAAAKSKLIVLQGKLDDLLKSKNKPRTQGPFGEGNRC